ncbi:MAG: amino acid adenylation domain-containing protein [Pseudomonadales bacterium]|nr:amino acid adenylation domain-containing protein [Pseudomonadales bacterium]
MPTDIDVNRDSARQLRTPHAGSLCALLEAQASVRPTATACAVLGDDLEIVDSRSFADLAAEANRIARGIRGLGVERGERVLLALPNGLDAVALFWGCMAAGVVAIPAPAPDQRRSGVALMRLAWIAENAEIALAITTPDLLAHVAAAQATVRWVSSATVLELAPGVSQAEPTIDRPEKIDPGSVAYLQYTSGSTSAPRGVVITHANALAQCAAIEGRVPTDPTRSRGLVWLPWYHDYGLVHAVLQPMFAGSPSFLMPTLNFMRHPLKWLQAIDRHRITHSGAPDFAYGACVLAAARTPNLHLDLGSWELASCGAEPVRAVTLDAFADTFEPHGFRRIALAPSYGLAEAVLAVTVNAGTGPTRMYADGARLERHLVRETDADAPGARTLIGCGEPLPGFDVRIVNPENHTPCPPDQIGEIWVAGASVGSGYWNDPEATRQTFHAALQTGDAAAGATDAALRYLRTGDLGFLHAGQLFITGRRKDLIVVHGRNLYPHDLEDAAQWAHPAIRAGGVMALGIDTGQREVLVLLVECAVRSSPEQVAEAIAAVRAVIAGGFEVDVHEVVPLRPGTLPRTSSGKPQRNAARTMYVEGQFADARLEARAAPIADGDPELLATLTGIFREVLGLDALAPDADLFSLGGDSLTATQIASRIRDRYGVDLPLRALFEAPTIQGLAAAVEQARTLPRSEPPQARPTAADAAASAAAGPARLSFSQERMWFMQAFAPDGTAYHMPLALRLEGSVDAGALARALDMVATRHDILRTRFETGPDGVVPVVDDAARPLFTIEMLRAAEGDPACGLPVRLAELASQRFDLASGPLLRMHLIGLADGAHVLFMVMHHIIGDQWSFAVLGRELAHCYGHALAGRTDDRPRPVLQYAQYAGWHRAWLEGARREHQLLYWKTRLAGLEPITLNADRMRPPERDFRGSQVRLDVQSDLFDRLAALGARHGATLSMVLIAALKVLLHRHTGRTDIGIGMPIANRNHLASEDLIGTFVNTLVLRTHLHPEGPFLDLLAQVRDHALESFEHQDIPFEQLLRELDLPQDASRSPLFDVMFNMINAPIGEIVFEGLAWARVDFDRRAAQFDLMVSVDPILTGSVVFEYATALFDRPTILRLAEHYRRLLETLVDRASVAISRLPLMGAEEARQLQSWGTGPARAPGIGFLARLHLTVQRYPEHQALLCDGQAMTYAELDAASDRIADTLAACSVRPGDRVGILLPRSPDMLTALIAVMKSGAAWVPMDPSYPRERLDFIASDAGLVLALTHSALRDRAGFVGTRVLCLDAELPAPAGTAPARPAPDPEAPAYLIYTSGSTGRPKGVVIPHRALDNFLTSMAITPGIGADDRVLAVTTLAFDIAILELLLPLTVGARIVLATEAQIADATTLAAMIDRHGITLLQTTPSRWHLMLQSEWGGSTPLVALCGGEPLPTALANPLRSRCRQLWNMYGPTETTVWSSCAPIDLPAPATMPLGRPIDNTRIVVLDQHGNLCPIGVPGEIWIGGAGLALGYHGRPELTAERFRHDAGTPTDDAQRLYRTGDLGRWHADGTLEHLGRLDDQVKVRGHRIELGEIEAVLESHPAVARAVIAVRGTEPALAELTAFVTGREPGLASAPLRDHLRAYLPAYMQPRHLVVLDRLPTLPNGKVDRRALPDPQPAPEQSGRFVAPRTAAERALWELWREQLGATEFGVHDNFFELGGHSILAVLLMHRIRERLGVDCPLPTLFRNPTIASLAQAIESHHRLEQAQLVALQPDGEQTPLFCIYGVETYRTLAARLGHDRPVYGMIVPSEIGLSSQESLTTQKDGPTIEQLASEYIALIRTRQPEGPYNLTGFSAGGVLAFEIAQRLRAEGHQIGLLAMIDCGYPSRSALTPWLWLKRRWLRLRQDGWRYPFLALRALRDPLAEARPDGADHGQDPATRRLIRATFARRNAIHMRAMREYRPTQYPGRAIYIRAADDPSDDAQYGWTTIMPRLQTYEVPGRHMDILEDPSATILAGIINGQLDRPRRR